MPGRIRIVVRKFPKLSETFIAQEIALLEARGHRVEIFALRHSGEAQTQSVTSNLRAPVSYLPRGAGRKAALRGGNARAFARHPVRYLRGLARAASDSRRAPGTRRMRRFFEGAWMAANGERPDHLHAHFLGDSALVASDAAALDGVSFTISAHAKDIYTTSPELVRRLARRCGALLTCTAHNAAYLRELSGVDPDRVHVVYHGIDLERFAPPAARGIVGPALQSMSVGRLVPKKGLDTQLRALALLRDRGVDVRHHIYGAGRLAGELDALARSLDLDTRVVFHGAVPSEEIVHGLADSDLFLCTSRLVDDGDRDGIPNTVAEAMAMEVPVVVTGVSGIPELVEDGECGLVVAPEDPTAVASTLR